MLRILPGLGKWTKGGLYRRRRQNKIRTALTPRDHLNRSNGLFDIDPGRRGFLLHSERSGNHATVV